MSEFTSLKHLLNHYIDKANISDFKIAGILGVAAPVISNEVNFVNNNFSFGSHGASVLSNTPSM